MPPVTFIGSRYQQDGVIRLTHRETGDRYSLVVQPDGTFRCYCNDCPQVKRPDRLAALRWAEQEARIASL